jgi:hypothetical protein
MYYIASTRLSKMTKPTTRLANATCSIVDPASACSGPHSKGIQGKTEAWAQQDQSPCAPNHPKHTGMQTTWWWVCDKRKEGACWALPLQRSPPVSGTKLQHGTHASNDKKEACVTVLNAADASTEKTSCLCTRTRCHSLPLKGTNHVEAPCSLLTAWQDRIRTSKGWTQGADINTCHTSTTLPFKRLRGGENTTHSELATHTTVETIKTTIQTEESWQDYHMPDTAMHLQQGQDCEVRNILHTCWPTGHINGLLVQRHTAGEEANHHDAFPVLD